MTALALLILSIGILHIEGTSLWGSMLIIVTAVLAGVQITSQLVSANSINSLPQTDQKCSECGLSKLGRVCCDDHPSVGG